jgi:hypothetical protein
VSKADYVREEVTKGQSRDHHCHARGCTAQVPPAIFMCGKHWKMVPKPMQSAVWRHYQKGQERGAVRPTREYFAATKAAEDHVWSLENKQGKLPL